MEALLALAEPRLAGVELGQVGAGLAAKQRRRQHPADPVLQTGATGLGAGRPGAELGHHAVPGAGDEAGLLQPRLGLKVLADGVFGRPGVGLLHAGHLAGLEALLAPGAHAGRRRRRVALHAGAAAHGHRQAAVPGAQLPVVHVLVPVAHAEAALLVVGPAGVLAVGVQGGPAVHVGAPDGAALAAAGSAVAAHAPPPWPWGSTAHVGTRLLRRTPSSRRGSKQGFNPQYRDGLCANVKFH